MGRIARIERWSADHAVAFAEVIDAHDSSWGSQWFELAGGRAVLSGPGLFVNRVIAAGIDRPVSAADLDELERRCATIGVPACVEVTPATTEQTRELLRRRGYRPERRVAALRVEPEAFDGAGEDERRPDDGSIVIERADQGQLAVWQELAAAGWGHDEPADRRASDAYARAASIIDGAGFVLARSADDGRPLGCASATIRGRVATLGGMSTIPSERRRGVQSALIRHRLGLVHAAGCDLVTSSTRPGSASERNLLRHGFVRSHVTVEMVRHTG